MLEELDMQTKPCVGCSYCCRKSPCQIARRVFGPVTECPALVWSETKERWFCDLCLKPGEIGARYREELYVGAGCCCSLNSDRQNIPRPKDKTPANPISRDCQILLRQFGKNAMFINSDLLAMVLLGAAKELGEEWKKAAVKALLENRDYRANEFQGPLREVEKI